jgi:DNA invertase Pin-like site-specific DNA recombinase
MATAEKPRRAATYSRVSTHEQSLDGQLEALRAYTTARGWRPTEYVDHGVSGARERRPGLDALLKAVRQRQVDVVVCTKLDRLARSVRHLVALGEEFRALGVELVVLDQAVDTTTSGGRALFGMLAVFAEFERDLIRERVIAGVRRARALGKHLGRPRVHRIDVERARELLAEGLSLRAVARSFKVHPMVVRRAVAAA